MPANTSVRRGYNFDLPQPGPIAVAGSFDPGGPFGGAAAVEGAIGFLCLYIGGIFYLVNCILGQATEVPRTQDQDIEAIDRHYEEAKSALSQMHPHRLEVDLESILSQIKDTTLELDNNESAKTIGELVKVFIKSCADLQEEARTKAQVIELAENCKTNINRVIDSDKNAETQTEEHAIHVQKRLNILLNVLTVGIVALVVVTNPTFAFYAVGLGALFMLGMFAETRKDNENTRNCAENKRVKIESVRKTINNEEKGCLDQLTRSICTGRN